MTMMLRRTALATALGMGLGLALPLAAQAQEIYIPLVSKGFQHQFWQAVKLGAENAAKEFKVKVTFEGPETEAMVDKQIDMLSAALAKNPKAIGFAVISSGRPVGPSPRWRWERENVSAQGFRSGPPASATRAATFAWLRLSRVCQSLK